MIEWERFSRKQMATMVWWCAGSPFQNREGIICDGAVRSGKTICLSMGFCLWAMSGFTGESFGLCGKTITSLRRNLLAPLLPQLKKLGMEVQEKPSQGWISLEWKGHANRFYLFGGKDEGSASLIQGVTLAGVLLDEVALMPRSFVEQALARCSVEGAKFWFSCNPEHPGHWFHQEWILKARQRKLLYLHFTMGDNPALSETVRKRYERMYSGSFYQRFVLGLWTAAQGAVYPMFCQEEHVVDQAPPCEEFYISCDYGTRNPMSMGLWGRAGDTWYRLKEFYHSGRESGEQKTDEEYYQALRELAQGREIQGVIVDPSAASFLECVRRHGQFPCIPADNRVELGIQRVGQWLKDGRLKFCRQCVNALREFQLYRWNPKADRDLPLKENDHAMDDIRYFVMTVSAPRQSAFFAASVGRMPSGKERNGIL